MNDSGVAILLIVTILSFYGCKKKSQSSVPKSDPYINEEGIKLSFTANAAAIVTEELVRNISFLAKSSDQNGDHKNLKDLSFNVQCKSLNTDQKSCFLVYDGPEIRLDIASLFFNTLNGSVFLRRRCKDSPCKTPKTKIFWNSSRITRNDGGENYELNINEMWG